MKRFLSLFLAVLLLSVVFAGCAGSGGGQGETTGKAGIGTGTPVGTAGETGIPQQTTGAPETESDYDKLTVRDFGGKDFTVLIPVNYDGGVENDFAGDPEGDIVDVALYTRQRTVEDRLKVNIQYDEQPGGWPERDSFMNLITEEVLSGTGRWELISGYAAYITSLTSQGCFMNWNDIPDINLNAGWWYRDIVEQMNVNDTLYFITGDLSLNSLKRLFCLFFDKDMMEDLQLALPFDAVREGSFTVDKLYSYITAAAADLNNDGTYDPANDRMGLVVNAGYQIMGFQTGMGVEICKKDKDGFPEITIFDNTEYVDRFLKIYEMVNETAGVTVGGGDSFRLMENDHALFVTFMLGGTEFLRNYDVNFGIVPFPKYNEEQKEYRTGSSDAFNMLCVPANVTDPSFVGMVTDHLAAESQQTVIPAYYDNNLKHRLIDVFDSDSAEMIDIMRRTSCYDFGTVNSVHCGDIAGTWGLLIDWKNNAIASYLESQRETIEALFSEFMDKSYYGG